MENFKGPEKLAKLYADAVDNLPNIYQNGISFCLAGSHGLGKTLVLTAILKKACQKNYSCLYTTLGDIVSVLIDSPNDEKFLARKELMTIDFLVIDEFDPRFCNSLASADLFGKMLEQVFRTRTQNNLPTLMASNSPNPIETFSGPIKYSIESLMSKVKIIPVMGKDFRKEIGSSEPNGN
jgi:DNA replication protein DnaC